MGVDAAEGAGDKRADLGLPEVGGAGDGDEDAVRTKGLPRR